RRAGGSMRDAESLLDQLFAFGADQITSEQVLQLLGAPPDDQIVELASAILSRDANSALTKLDEAAREATQYGELLDRLIDYWRDVMIVNCGESSAILTISHRFHETLCKHAQSISLDTILAGLDILTTAKSRLRLSPHSRVIMEMTLVRLARLDDLM